MNLASVPHYVQQFKKSGMVLLDDFGDIVLKTADLCSAKDDCVRLKKCAGQSRQQATDALVKRANTGKPDGVNVLLRPGERGNRWITRVRRSLHRAVYHA